MHSCCRADETLGVSCVADTPAVVSAVDATGDVGEPILSHDMRHGCDRMTQLSGQPYQHGLYPSQVDLALSASKMATVPAHTGSRSLMRSPVVLSKASPCR